MEVVRNSMQAEKKNQTSAICNPEMVIKPHIMEEESSENQQTLP